MIVQKFSNCNFLNSSYDSLTPLQNVLRNQDRSYPNQVVYVKTMVAIDSFISPYLKLPWFFCDNIRGFVSRKISSSCSLHQMNGLVVVGTGQEVPYTLFSHKSQGPLIV